MDGIERGGRGHSNVSKEGAVACREGAEAVVGVYETVVVGSGEGDGLGEDDGCVSVQEGVVGEIEGDGKIGDGVYYIVSIGEGKECRVDCGLCNVWVILLSGLFGVISVVGGGEIEGVVGGYWIFYSEEENEVGEWVGCCSIERGDFDLAVEDALGRVRGGNGANTGSTGEYAAGVDSDSLVYLEEKVIG